MNWVRTIAGVLVLWSSTAWGATLTWNANSEPDLAGYRVYQCSQQPCTRTSSNASLLVTLGTVTSFNIGTPAVTQFYIITAYDFANNESAESNLATFTPAESPPPPIAPPPVTPPPVAPPPVAPPPVAPPPVVLPAIGVSLTSLSFAATQGDANPATQILSISNTGGGTLNWTASDNAAWLRLSRTSGTNNGLVIASVVTGATAVGTYNGTITLSAIGASPVTVPVTFTVATAPVSPPVVPPPAPLTAPPTPGGLHISAVQKDLSDIEIRKRKDTGAGLAIQHFAARGGDLVYLVSSVSLVCLVRQTRETRQTHARVSRGVRAAAPVGLSSIGALYLIGTSGFEEGPDTDEIDLAGVTKCQFTRPAGFH